MSENILHLYSDSVSVRKICHWLSTADLQDRARTECSESKGKLHPITGHEGPEVEQIIALLFLQPHR